VLSDRIGIAVITHNRRDQVLDTLGRLRALPEDVEVVVVDNGSVDGTAGQIVRRFPDVTLLCPGANLGAAGRNLAVERLTTDYVAFADDDTWWEPGSLTEGVRLLDQYPQLGLVTARILVEPTGRVDPICEEMARSPLHRHAGMPGHPLLSFLAGASIVRRRAFLEMGGFSSRVFIGGEEEHLAADLASAGWRMAYVPDLVVHHRAGVRDAHRRRRFGIRNTLWFTWERRPLPSAVRRTARLVGRLPRDRVTMLGVLDAVTGIPAVLAHRRVVPPAVETGYRLLDNQQLRSTARRYVS
jgi:GT2 family glycosyltransferase